MVSRGNKERDLEVGPEKGDKQGNTNKKTSERSLLEVGDQESLPDSENVSQTSCHERLWSGDVSPMIGGETSSPTIRMVAARPLNVWF